MGLNVQNVMVGFAINREEEKHMFKIEERINTLDKSIEVIVRENKHTTKPIEIVLIGSTDSKAIRLLLSEIINIKEVECIKKLQIKKKQHTYIYVDITQIHNFTRKLYRIINNLKEELKY